MPRKLWLYIYKVRASHIRGERRSPLRVCAKHSSAVFSQVVFMTEGDRDSSVSIPAHFAILVLFPHRETCSLTKEQTKRHRQLIWLRQVILDRGFVSLGEVNLAMLLETRACVALAQGLEGRPMLGELLGDTFLGRDD